MIIIKSDYEISLMKNAGAVTAKAHEAVEKYISPGISTLELDDIVKDIIYSNNAVPTFKGYQGYPRNICTSVNEQVVHGIPSADVILKEGDIVSVDIGATLKGYVGDQAKTYPVGKVSDEAIKLIEVTRNSFYEGLKFCTEKYRISDIGKAIGEYAESFGYGVVRDYTGHGVGAQMHEDPSVPNYFEEGMPRGKKLRKGMTLAIEPMINEGAYGEHVLEDGWTVVTNDGKLSAHYEHSVAITDGEPIILTEV